VIPTALVIAFLGAILWPTRAVLVTAAISMGWVALVLVEGSLSSLADRVGAAALGVVNAAVGFGVGWAVRRLISRPVSERP
jgi:hypothetical protein